MDQTPRRRESAACLRARETSEERENRRTAIREAMRAARALETVPQAENRRTANRQAMRAA